MSQSPMKLLALVGLGSLALCSAKPVANVASPVANPTALPERKFSPYSDYNPDPCYRAQSHDAADLCAQWRAAIAGEASAKEARRATNWAIMGTILSLLSLGGVIYALWLNLQANRTAREALIADQRAWLAVSATPNWLRSISGKAQLQLSVNIENIGRSPASDIRVRTGLFIPNGKGDQPNMLDNFHMLKADVVRGYTLLPGEKHSQDSSASCSLEEFKKSDLFGATGSAQIGVMISVHYRAAGMVTQSQTTTGFYLIHSGYPQDFKRFLFHHANLTTQGDGLDLEKFEGGHAT